MAGPTSEAGHLNIGTAGSSSHPEIEPEIEAVEAIGDSNEVCGLERKECDEIMEHLKTNPGLVVKSLGPEGRIVLVMAGETKEPKPPASKCTDKGFSEAVVDSDWYRALRSQDCKALMALLKENPCLVAQRGPQGRTVLHAAARRGCLQLLLQVSDLFKDEGQFVDEISGLKVAWADLREAKCGAFEAEAQHMAWFSCPIGVWRTLRWGHRLKSTQGFRCRVSQDLTDKLIEIMQRNPSKKAFKDLERGYQQDRDYNFLFEPGCERKELQFHYACGEMRFRLRRDTAEEYVKTIIDGCLELEPSQSVEVLTYLFQLQNAQGKTPFHVAQGKGTTKLLKLVPPGVDYKECLNARNERGWTTLHCAAATGDHEALEALLKDDRVDVNARTITLDALFEDERVIASRRRSTDDWITYKDEQVHPSTMMEGKTALHLAILHNDARSVELLLTKCCHTDVNAPLYRYIVCGYERIKPGEDFEKREKIKDKRSIWSPLQLAAIMGLSDVVRVLLMLKLDDIYDDGKLQNNTTVKEDFRGVPALLFASASGNPDTLRLFVDNPKLNSLVKSREGATALHYATNAMIPLLQRSLFLPKLHKIGPCVWFTDSGYFNSNTSIYKEHELMYIKSTPTSSYLGRQACITMLLQAGVDIWERDNDKRFPELGPEAPEEGLLWWYQKIAQETLEAKKSLNDAANAISVVAALVATASFVGPLQPPLGYGDSMEGGVQDTHLSIRVFMVSNILSFYLAVASIMFAIVPSLPMPQEGIYAEWQRTRRTVGVAIFFLLMSVLGVLISFGAASNSVVSEDYSWRHVGLSFYPTLVGGFICILGIGLFFLRLLRLVFNRNAKIRYLYKTFVKF